MQSIESKVKRFQRLCDEINDKIDANKRVTVKELRTFRQLESELSHSAKTSDKNVYTSYRAAEVYSGINRGTLHRYVQQGRLQRKDNGFLRSDLDRIVSERKNQGSRYTIYDEIKNEELKYRKWKAIREELIVKQLQESSIPVENMKIAFEARAYELSRSLLFLSRMVSHKIAAKTSNEYKFVSNIIDEEVRQFMDAYSSVSKYPQ